MKETKKCRVWRSAKRARKKEKFENIKIKTKTNSKNRESTPDLSFFYSFRNDVLVVDESSPMP